MGIALEHVQHRVLHAPARANFGRKVANKIKMILDGEADDQQNDGAGDGRAIPSSGAPRSVSSVGDDTVDPQPLNINLTLAEVLNERQKLEALEEIQKQGTNALQLMAAIDAKSVQDWHR